MKFRQEQSDTWLRYFYAECARRGWSSGGICQLEARENSGSITLNTGTKQPQLAVVWERKRRGPIKVRARSAGTPESPQTLAQEFFAAVNERCRSGVTERFYRRGQLCYDGLAWRGELWLNDTLRLAPPAQQDQTALLGPRIILVDAMVNCVGQSDFPFVFTQMLQELSAFLTVVMGTAVQLPEIGRAWTYVTGAADCTVRNLGYFQLENPQQMPTRGSCRTVPVRPVTRPDFSQRGIDGSSDEEVLPADINDLWAMYLALSPDLRRQFQQVAAKWQEALLHWGQARTLSYALMVVACEALKPQIHDFRDHNIYQVIEALLGKPTADRLQEHWFRPQDVRSAHLHYGEFRASEFVFDMMMSSYHDPTFDQAHRELCRVTQTAIIEWLQRGGNFTMPRYTQKKTIRRWAKEYILSVLTGFVCGGVAAGTALGWLLRMIWHG